MKRLFMSLLATMLLVATVQAQDAIGAFLVDSDGPYTNIRNAPNGKIVDRISTKTTADMTLSVPRNGWWRIMGDSYNNYDKETEVSLKGSKTGYWIHYSCVGFSTRNYGGEEIYLRATPSNKGKVLWKTTETEILLHPVDVKGDWIKVKTNDKKHEGWINNLWICDNPVTTCP